MKRLPGILGLAMAFSLLTAAPSSAQVHLGPQLSLGTDSDVGIGARVVAGVPRYSGLEFAGTFDVFFPDGDYDYWELNGNLLYNFQLPEAPSLRLYAGGGLNVARIDDVGPNDVGDTEVGLNLVGGSKFPNSGPVTPYVELRGIIEGGDQLVLTGGILFP